MQGLCHPRCVASWKPHERPWPLRYNGPCAKLRKAVQRLSGSSIKSVYMNSRAEMLEQGAWFLGVQNKHLLSNKVADRQRTNLLLRQRARQQEHRRECLDGRLDVVRQTQSSLVLDVTI